MINTQIQGMNDYTDDHDWETGVIDGVRLIKQMLTDWLIG